MKSQIIPSPIDTSKYAFQNFPLYKSLYEHIDLNKWDSIPFTTKEMLQQHLAEFESFYPKKFYVTTGGVTGSPAKFYQSSNVWFKELAFVYDFFEQHGYTPPAIKASFRGGDFGNLKKGEFWKTNPIHHELHFSPFHLSEKTIGNYVQKINEVKPKFFHGYPSALVSFTRLMVKAGLRLNYKIDCVFLISEAFSQHDIQFLKMYLHCEVTSFYGHSERLIFAAGNSELTSYTPNPLYGFVELIDKNGNVIKENNVIGELVGTSFDNNAMPLVRYRTGDLTYFTDYSTKSFGPVQGKWNQPNLVGINNEQITLTALNLHSHELENIQHLQFLQEEPGIVSVLVCYKSIFQGQNQQIKNLLDNRVGKLISFEVREVESFILNSRGKAPLIIQNTPIKT